MPPLLIPPPELKNVHGLPVQVPLNEPPAVFCWINELSMVSEAVKRAEFGSSRLSMPPPIDPAEAALPLITTSDRLNTPVLLRPAPWKNRSASAPLVMLSPVIAIGVLLRASKMRNRLVELRATISRPEPGPVIEVPSRTAGRPLVRLIVQTPLQPGSAGGMLNVIVSAPGSPVAARIASRSEQSASQTPSFVSAVLVTTMVFAKSTSATKICPVLGAFFVFVIGPAQVKSPR